MQHLIITLYHTLDTLYPQTNYYSFVLYRASCDGFDLSGDSMDGFGSNGFNGSDVGDGFDDNVASSSDKDLSGMSE